MGWENSAGEVFMRKKSAHGAATSWKLETCVVQVISVRVSPFLFVFLGGKLGI